MGRYFGLINITRNHRVSSYWKNSPPCPDEVKDIANHLKWNLETDDISAIAPCEQYRLVNNEWKEVDLLASNSDSETTETTEPNWISYGLDTDGRPVEELFRLGWFCE